MGTSGENVAYRISRSRSIGFTSSYKIIVGVIYIMLLSNASWRNWWNKG